MDRLYSKVIRMLILPDEATFPLFILKALKRRAQKHIQQVVSNAIITCLVEESFHIERHLPYYESDHLLNKSETRPFYRFIDRDWVCFLMAYFCEIKNLDTHFLMGYPLPIDFLFTGRLFIFLDSGMPITTTAGNVKEIKRILTNQWSSICLESSLQTCVA